jgi:uridine nucleosidase
MTQSEEKNDIIDIWLDCDPGFDDVFAIILATSHPRLNLLGVSTTSGNTTIKNTTQNALNVLSMLGKANIPVYMGSQNPSIKGTKLGYDKHG